MLRSVGHHEILAIIPARGGSKKIPDKNRALVGGRPLIEWTIRAAKKSKYLSRVIISTDSDSIAELCQKYGVEVPFLRPGELAKDDTPGISPILHALEYLRQEENYAPEFTITLQPTSPLRTTQDIDASIELIKAKKADAVVSVCPVEEHPYWMKNLSESGKMTDFIKLDEPITRRQDLPPIYSLNGAIYLANSDFLIEQETWFGSNTFGYIMPVERSLDIDTPLDLKLADFFLKGETGI
jgi:N-acylneuraminate cytidylyltransferase/CMP-N,N'-diacetyllegionaminic acid synthase